MTNVTGEWAIKEAYRFYTEADSTPQKMAILNFIAGLLNTFKLEEVECEEKAIVVERGVAL